MESKPTPSKEELFRKSLENGSDEYIISILSELREEGEGYMVAPIAELLFSDKDERLKNEVVNLLVDLKNQSYAETIVQLIKKHRNSKDIYRLVSVCWQSRLNFAPHVDLFMELAGNDDYQTALEAITVVENLLDSLDNDTLVKLKQKGEVICNNASRTKPLMENLLSYIDERL